MTHGWAATKRRCSLERIRFGSAMASTLLSTFGDDVPAFDIGEGYVVRTPRANVLGIKFCLEALQLCFGERHHFVLTARVGLGLPSWAPGMSAPRFRSANSP